MRLFASSVHPCAVVVNYEHHGEVGWCFEAYCRRGSGRAATDAGVRGPGTVGRGLHMDVLAPALCCIDRRLQALPSDKNNCDRHDQSERCRFGNVGDPCFLTTSWIESVADKCEAIH